MRRGYLTTFLLFACPAFAWAGPLEAASNASSPAADPEAARPVIDQIRSKLKDPNFRSQTNALDIAALQAFYSSRAAPLWITDVGLSARGQSALFEIEKANDWGLDAAAF